jgi:polysaccharide biosynthesis protein PslH
MKILWVKTDFLHPTTRGGQIRTLETVKQLHRRHEVHYIAFDDPAQPEGPDRAGEYAAKWWAVPHDVPPKTSPKFAWQLVKGLVDPLPVAVLRYRSARMRERIEALLAAERYDRVVCDFPFPAPNLPDIRQCILFQHNVETMIWRRHAEHGATAVHRWYFQRQAERMFTFERELCRRAGFVIAVSEKDAATIRTEFGIEHVDDVPTGVDVDGFRHPDGPAEKRAEIVFVGSMDWMANIDGAEWLAGEVLPRIWARRPETRVALVGRNPAGQVREIGARDGRVTVTGTVDDVRPWLWGAGLSVVPLRIGGGTRLKIYEAMAAGVATVSTTVGAEGLPVRDGEHLRLADDAEEFARACVELLENEGERRRLAAAARKLVEERYSWEAATRRFEELLLAAPRAT